MKRSYEGSMEHAAKKHKSHDSKQGHRSSSENISKPAQTTPYQKAYSSLPPYTGEKAVVSSYVPFKVPKDLPELPPLSDSLVHAPFVHKSGTSGGYDRNSTAGDMSYERLEFLGDAYLELFASRLIFHHYPQLPAGSQSQLRELLVKNETLAEYATAYGFDKRVDLIAKAKLSKDAQGRGNKGMNKVLGDVFEAYVAAAVLSDVENGFAVTEKWLSTLWAPKLLKGLPHYVSALNMQQPADADPRTTYNPAGKSDLQRMIMGAGVKLEYKPYRASVELKGDQLGMNHHYIAVYLTGWGHTDKLLGKGEGKNKVEAGNWAATEAIHGESKDLVKQLETQMSAQKAARRQAMAATSGAQ